MTISGVGMIILILQKSSDTSLTNGNNGMRLLKQSIPGLRMFISLEQGFCCVIYCCISCPDVDSDEGEEEISRYHVHNLTGCQAALDTD